MRGNFENMCRFTPGGRTKIEDLLATLLPRYAEGGKAYITIAFGCTGGKHRSVYLAERLAEHARALGWEEVATFHRELD